MHNSDFILDIEGLPKIKSDQDFERPNNESQQGYRRLIPEVQHGNDHVGGRAGVSQYSKSVEPVESHRGVAGKPANPNSE